MCEKIVSNDVGGGYELCDTCWPDTVSVASYARPEFSCSIDNSGMIWTGMPDEPEPETYLSSLPVWHEHPDEACYRAFPFSKLEEQLELVDMCHFSRHNAKRDNVPPQAVTYVCFVCGRQHDALAAPDMHESAFSLQ